MSDNELPRPDDDEVNTCRRVTVKLASGLRAQVCVDTRFAPPGA